METLAASAAPSLPARGGIRPPHDDSIQNEHALVSALAVADDPARLHRPPFGVIDARVGVALRPDLGEPLANAERDAELLDRLWVVVHVLVLPHRRWHIEHIARL